MNNKDDFENFVRMMSLAAEQYGKQMSPDLIALYFDSLKDLPIEAVRSAVSRHLRNPDVGQFMPKIADIIRACEGGGEDAAFQALNTLNGAFRVGAWESVSFIDPIITLVVTDMGGWQAMCERDAEEWTNFGSREFVKRYRAYRERPTLPQAPKVLIGRIEGQNNSMGYQLEHKPVLIGDRTKALPDQRNG